MTIVIRYPNTAESQKIFNERMQTPPDQIRDGDVWNTIKELAPQWMERKRAGICLPDRPVLRSEYWKEHAKYSRPVLFTQLDQFIDNTLGVGKTAIDIGCGTGIITQKLLEAGWNVIAVDPCFEALEILASNNLTYADQLTLICKKITKFTPQSPVDLVVCKEVLSYVNPAKFQAVWEKIYNSLKKDGALFGTLIAEDPSKLTFVNQLKEIGAWALPDKQQILTLLEGTGYKVEKTAHSIHAQLEGNPRSTYQFSAQKI